MSAEAITRALGGSWNGRAGVARCPAHEDRSPSLSLTDGADGLLLHCFAGCSFTDIIAALRDKGLVDDGRRGASLPRPKPTPRQETDHGEQSRIDLR